MKKIGFLFVLLALILVVGIALRAGNRGEKEQSAEQMVAYMQGQLATGQLTSVEDIEKAIQKGAEQFKISLSREDKDKILEVMNKLMELGPDPDELSKKAQALYAEYKDELLERVQESVKESVSDSVSDYFNEMGPRVTDFFANIFS